MITQKKIKILLVGTLFFILNTSILIANLPSIASTSASTLLLNAKNGDGSDMMVVPKLSDISNQMMLVNQKTSGFTNMYFSQTTGFGDYYNYLLGTTKKALEGGITAGTMYYQNNTLELIFLILAIAAIFVQSGFMFNRRLARKKYDELRRSRREIARARIKKELMDAQAQLAMARKF